MGDPNYWKELKLAKEQTEFRKKQIDEIIETEKINMDERSLDRSLWRRLHFERQEAEEEKKIARAKESEGWRLDELAQEEKIAIEMEQMKRNNLRELKLRQQLRECEELRELESQLRRAYTNKELALQIEQNKLKKMELDLKEKEYMTDKAEIRISEEFERQRAIEEAKKTKEYREFLQDQIIDKYKAKQEEYKQFLLEKSLIDDAVRTILEEDQKEEEARILRNKKNKEDIQSMIEARKMWMIKEKEEQEAEDRRVREYLEKKFLDEKILQEKNRAKKEKLAKQQELVAKKMFEEESKKKDRENLIAILAEEELREKFENEERKKIEEGIRIRIETNKIFSKQIEDKMAKLNEERKRDEEYSQQLLAQFLADSKLEELSTEKRRLKEIAYRKQLKEDIQERHKKRLLEAQNQISLQKLEEKAKEERRKLIEEERIRLLQEHASKLIGYLPRGLLRDSDISLLGSDVQDYYKPVTT